MKIKELRHLTDEQLINMDLFFDYMLQINNDTNFLSISEQEILNNWKKQIDKTI